MAKKIIKKTNKKSKVNLTLCQKLDNWFSMFFVRIKKFMG